MYIDKSVWHIIYRSPGYYYSAFIKTNLIAVRINGLLIFVWSEKKTKNVSLLKNKKKLTAQNGKRHREFHIGNTAYACVDNFTFDVAIIQDDYIKYVFSNYF